MRRLLPARSLRPNVMDVSVSERTHGRGVRRLRVCETPGRTVRNVGCGPMPTMWEEDYR